MTSSIEELQFAFSIQNALEANPGWLNSAIKAISTGMEKAIEKQSRAYAEKDMAFLAALGLASESRLSKEARDLLLQKVCAGISTNNACKAEQEFLDHAERAMGSDQ